MRLRAALAAAGAVIGFVIDQYAKYSVSRLPEGSLLASWGPFGIERLLNHSVFIWIPLPGPILVGLTVLIFTILLGTTAFIIVRKYWHLLPGMLLILAGGASNLIDRILYQRTVDYIRFFGLVGNIADILIVLGLCMLLPILSSRKEHLHV